MKVGSLFSGYGGLDRAVEAVLGARTAWVSDIDPGACRILAHRWPDVPNLGDISAVDWQSVEPVDVLTGGFPCQDVSHAGKRGGLRPDTRTGLWSQMAYAIDQLRPALVVAENVRGLLSAQAHSDVEPCPWCVGDDADGALRALGAVLGDLADIGYDARWVGLRAADVGAPHGRFRIFVAAWPAADAERDRWERWPETDSAGREDGGGSRTATTRRGSDPAADADRFGWQQPGVARRRGAGLADDGQSAPDADDATDNREWARPEPRSGGPTADAPFNEGRVRDRNDGIAPNAVGQRRWTARRYDGLRTEGLVQGDIAWGVYEPAIRRWERVLGRVAPAPTEAGPKGGQRLSPAFVEWMQGLPAGHVTDPAIWAGMTDSAARNAQLKALGNGVVPQQAEAALRWLLAALEVAA